MCINRKAPHGSIYAQESLDLVLVAAAFNQEVSLVFLDDGVYQLISEQNTQSIGSKNFWKTFKSLAHHEVDNLYVEAESLQKRGLSVEDLIVSVDVMDSTELGQLFEQQDLLISF